MSKLDKLLMTKQIWKKTVEIAKNICISFLTFILTFCENQMR